MPPKPANNPKKPQGEDEAKSKATPSPQSGSAVQTAGKVWDMLIMFEKGQDVTDRFWVSI